MQVWLSSVLLGLVLLLILPFCFVAFRSVRALSRRTRAINKRMAPGDRRIGRVVWLVWLAVVAVLFVAVWALTGDPGKGVLAVVIGAAVAGVLGPVVVLGLRLPSRGELADPARPKVGPFSPGWKEDNSWMDS
jgi:hypothetical protein